MDYLPVDSCVVCGAELRQSCDSCCVSEFTWFKDNDISERSPSFCDCMQHGKPRKCSNQIFNPKQRNLTCMCRMSTGTLPEMLDFRLDENGAKTVIARLDLPPRSLFGPFVAPLAPRFDGSSSKSPYSLISSSVTGEFCKFDLLMDSDESCNWMKHVRFSLAREAANLVAFQFCDAIFFVVVDLIPIGEELVVTYNDSYSNLLHSVKAESLDFPVCISKADIEWNLTPLSTDEPQEQVDLSPEPTSVMAQDGTDDGVLERKVSRKRGRNVRSTLSTAGTGANTSTSICSPDATVETEKVRLRKRRSYNKRVKRMDISDAADASLNPDAPLEVPPGANRDSLCNEKLLLGVTDTVAALPAARPANNPKKKLPKPRVFYSCSYCHANFIRPELLEHYNEHLVDGKFHCPKRCPAYYATVPELEMHLRAKHGATQVCEICGFSGPKRAVRSHQIIHEEASHTCETCGVKFNSPSGLKDHIARAHTDKPLRSRAPTKVPFRHHVQRDKWQTYFYKCAECQLGFWTKKHYNDHLDNKHPDVQKTTVPELNLPTRMIDTFYCRVGICHRRFSTAADTERHLTKHHPEEDVKAACQKRFNAGRLYNKVPLFGGAAFQRSTELFYCHYCDRGFGGPRHFLHHIKSAHPDYHDVLMPHAPKNIQYLVLYDNGKRRGAPADEDKEHLE